MGNFGVGLGFVGMKLGKLIDVLFDDRGKGGALGVWNNLRHHVTLALNHSKNDGFLFQVFSPGRVIIPLAYVV
jgi:hypothetical protein